MFARAALLVGACLLAAGCKPATSEPSVHEQEAARAKQIEDLKGWSRAFDAPDAAVGAANQFGFRPTAYAAAGKGFESRGGPVLIASGDKASQVSFAATGAIADKVDRIEFALALGDEDAGMHARRRFEKMIADYLFQFRIEDEEKVLSAITRSKDAQGTIAGAPTAIDATPRTITVTFTRPAEAPATQPQGK